MAQKPSFNPKRLSFNRLIRGPDMDLVGSVLVAVTSAFVWRNDGTAGLAVGHGWHFDSGVSRRCAYFQLSYCYICHYDPSKTNRDKLHCTASTWTIWNDNFKKRWGDVFEWWGWAYAMMPQAWTQNQYNKDHSKCLPLIQWVRPCRRL